MVLTSPSGLCSLCFHQTASAPSFFPLKSTLLKVRQEELENRQDGVWSITVIYVVHIGPSPAPHLLVPVLSLQTKTQ